MNTFKAWKDAIIVAASSKLKRGLSDRERRFIARRRSFIILEEISDTIRSGSKESIDRYLNE